VMEAAHGNPVAMKLGKRGNRPAIAISIELDPSATCLPLSRRG
jgi:hypothetical protein